jgi:hypothetical protein
VNALYAAIRWLFQPGDDPVGPVALGTDLGLKPGWHLKPEDFVPAEVVNRFASHVVEWGSIAGMIVHPVTDGYSGLQAIDEITAQGEGLPGAANSHFTRFLSLLDSFEAGAVGVKDMPRTPFIAAQPAPEDPLGSEITHPYTRLWAELFNLQYEALLVRIAWAISHPHDNPSRAEMIEILSRVMNQVTQPLSRYLTGRAMNETSAIKAGPAYGLSDETMPYDVAGFADRFQSLNARQTRTVTAIQEAIEFATDGPGKIRLDSVQQLDEEFAAFLPKGSLPVKYAIYPSIGFARIGNSPTGFFIGPESPGSTGVEIGADGAETPITSFKDDEFRVKRQGARFRLFEIPTDGGDPRPANLPEGATVRWKVTLANKKDAVIRPSAPPDQPTASDHSRQFQAGSRHHRVGRGGGSFRRPVAVERYVSRRCCIVGRHSDGRCAAADRPRRLGTIRVALHTPCSHRRQFL